MFSDWSCGVRMGGDIFLCRFSLILVEINALSVGGYLFEMMIWADCFVLLERGFLGKLVGTDLLIDVVVEVVAVEAVDVVRAGLFVFFRSGCLENMIGVRMVIGGVVGAVVLVWWRWSVV